MRVVLRLVAGLRAAVFLRVVLRAVVLRAVVLRLVALRTVRFFLAGMFTTSSHREIKGTIKLHSNYTKVEVIIEHEGKMITAYY